MKKFHSQLPFRVEMDRQKKEMKEKKSLKFVIKKTHSIYFLVGLALRELWQAKKKWK